MHHLAFGEIFMAGAQASSLPLQCRFGVKVLVGNVCEIDLRIEADQEATPIHYDLCQTIGKRLSAWRFMRS